MIMYSFFRYFEVSLLHSYCTSAQSLSLYQEYHKNPSSIGGRRYTPYAQWKFREFNELPHIFTRRLDESYPLSSMYIGQFPNEKMTIIMRLVFGFITELLWIKCLYSFVAFIAGSFAAVLVLASVIDPDLVLHFEITPHRTVLFYLGVFGSILAAVRGMIPEDNRVFDPELLMTEVIEYTHYMPDEWKDQLHSKKVLCFYLCTTLLFIQGFSTGSPRIRRAICDEGCYIRTGDCFSRYDPFRPLVFTTTMRSCSR